MPKCLAAGLAGLLAVGMAAPRAGAATIPVFSTGNGQTNDGYVDPHWTYTLVNNTGEGPDSGTAHAFVLGNVPTDEYGGWTANSAARAWIGDDTAGNQSGYSSFQADGALSFSQSFSLSGLDPATAQISGYWTADDAGYLLLNDTVISTLDSWSDGLIAFSAPSSDFVAGTNVLTVEISVSDDAWEGAMVEIDSATAASAVPEPLSLAGFGTGLSGLALARRRRRV